MSEIKFETAEQKASYGIGLQMGQQLAGSGLEALALTLSLRVSQQH